MEPQPSMPLAQGGDKRARPESSRDPHRRRSGFHLAACRDRRRREPPRWIQVVLLPCPLDRRRKTTDRARFHRGGKGLRSETGLRRRAGSDAALGGIPMALERFYGSQEVPDLHDSCDFSKTSARIGHAKQSATGHDRWMAEAISLARGMRGLVWPNPPVGCVIVRDGEIVGRGHTQPGGRPHAERVALDEEGERAKGAIFYVTLEPCCHWGRTPPCADAIIAAGVYTVHASLQDPDPRVGAASQSFARLASRWRWGWPPSRLGKSWPASFIGSKQDCR